MNRNSIMLYSQDEDRHPPELVMNGTREYLAWVMVMMYPNVSTLEQ